MLTMSSTGFIDRGGKHLVAAMTGALFLGLTEQGLAQSGPRIETNDNAISVRVGNQLVARYQFVPNPFKPYIDQFRTPAGINVLRDSPSDHKHHHGLMFAIAVDDLNFWEEHDAPGKQVHRGYSGLKADKVSGLDRAAFTQSLDWINPRDKKLYLREQRTIEVYVGKNLGASLLTWQTRLTLPPGKTSATLTGHRYFGLGARFLQSMDEGGYFQNADGKTTVAGTNLVPSRWCAYTAKADGKLVTFTMFDHPGNVRHPAVWYTMGDKPKEFAYMSDTLNFKKKPLTLEAGKPLLLRYGVGLWDGKIPAERIEKLYRRWVRLSSADRAVGSATE